MCAPSFFAVIATGTATGVLSGKVTAGRAAERAVVARTRSDANVIGSEGPDVRVSVIVRSAAVANGPAFTLVQPHAFVGREQEMAQLRPDRCAARDGDRLHVLQLLQQLERRPHLDEPVALLVGGKVGDVARAAGDGRLQRRRVVRERRSAWPRSPREPWLPPPSASPLRCRRRPSSRAEARTAPLASPWLAIARVRGHLPARRNQVGFERAGAARAVRKRAPVQVVVVLGDEAAS